MKKFMKFALLGASLLTLAACGSSGSSKKCTGDGGVCRIGDEKRKEAIHVASYFKE